MKRSILFLFITLQSYSMQNQRIIGNRISYQDSKFIIQIKNPNQVVEGEIVAFQQEGELCYAQVSVAPGANMYGLIKAAVGRQILGRAINFVRVYKLPQVFE